MKAGVVIFPGSNCDKDMIHILSVVLGIETVELWHKDHDLQNADLVVLPGGFSYGDYLRSGSIARFSPIMQSVIEFANKGGLVFGICNGFQILCESHLLPGALLKNTNGNFICKNVFLKPANNSIVINENISENEVLKIPIAHGEGRFYINEKEGKEILNNQQIIFQYCNSKGEITEDANPNGSWMNVAGICNYKKNVFGMMPHPERASENSLGNTDGLKIFHSLLKKTLV